MAAVALASPCRAGAHSQGHAVGALGRLALAMPAAHDVVGAAFRRPAEAAAASRDDRCRHPLRRPDHRAPRPPSSTGVAHPVRRGVRGT